ncbi:T9SS type A sorting domain-containing protein [candidate division WOR-3 bacterium]|nr:T9SS type A sorting domain-containing protein [candidate division WOR-3 bacterium]
MTLVPVSGISESRPVRANASVRCWPNPTDRRTVLSFAPDACGPLTVTIRDAAGRTVETLRSDGSSLSISTTGYQPGVYYCTARTPDRTETVRLRVVH